MDRLLSAMAIFIEYPLLAAAVGVVLAGTGRRTHSRAAVAVGIVWLLYALYEFGMKQRWLCSEECNIRLDLFIIYPCLVMGLVASGVSLLRGESGSRPPM